MRTRALAIRIIRQFLRDRRTMALLFLAPLLVLTLMHFVFNGQQVKPDIALVNIPSLFADRLDPEAARFVPYHDMTQAKLDLEKGKLDAVLSIKNGRPALLAEGTDPSMTRAVMIALQKSLQSDTISLLPEVSYMHGNEDLSAFDSFGPVLVGFFSFFFVFLLAGVAFLRERTTGTLERLLATPIRRSEVVAGYLLGFGLFTLLQATLIAWFAIHVLGMYMDGSIWLVLLMNLLISLTALTLGTLLSTFANTEFQVIQFIPLVIVPQVFFSGLFNLEAMDPWLQKLSYIMPMYYGADAMKDIMLRGASLADILLNIYILLGFSIAFIVLNIAALKKQRAI
jgi:ABC-2 type transport system permease protein